MAPRSQEVQKKKVTEGIGDRIRQARKLLKITQQGLAEISGHSKSQLAQWEIGARTPGVDGVFALSSAMRISFSWLATGLGDLRAEKGLEEVPRFSSALLRSSMACAHEYVTEKRLANAIDPFDLTNQLYLIGVKGGFDDPAKTTEECTDFLRLARISLQLGVMAPD